MRAGQSDMRTLGHTNIEVSPLCFGGNVFGWTLDESKSFGILDAFTDEYGFNFIDTADSYSRWVPGNKGGESETIIGKWMKKKGNRQHIILATKLGSDLGGDNKGLSRTYVFRAIEASLKRLQTDYIDLYQSHYDDLSTPVEETLGAYAELIRQGKIRAIGASNITKERFAESLQVSAAKGYPSYQTLQPLYNLYDREEFERDFQPFCVKHGISIIPYYSLASGFLTGKYKSKQDLVKSVRGGGIEKYLNPKGIAILSMLDKIAAIHQTTPASISLAWLLSKPNIAAPIASATSVQQLKELVTGTRIKLSKDEIEQLDKAGEHVTSVNV